MRGGFGALLFLGLLLSGAALLVLLWQSEPTTVEPPPPGPVVESTSAEPEPAPATLVDLAAETLVAAAEPLTSLTAQDQPSPTLDDADDNVLRVRLTWVPDSEGPLPPGGGRPLPTASVVVDLPSFRALSADLDLDPAALGLPPPEGTRKVRWHKKGTASLTVVAGPDEGKGAFLRQVEGLSGELSLGGLHPAVQVVELRAGELVLARRRLALVADSAATIVGPQIGGWAAVTVLLRSPDGEPLPPSDYWDAPVTLDGRSGYVTEDGLRFVGAYPPDALLEANVNDFAKFRGVRPHTAGQRWDLVLEHADVLSVRSSELAPPPRLADFWLLPANPANSTTWPHERRSEVLSPEGTVFVGLSPKDAVAFVRHGGPGPRHGIARARAGGVAELGFDLLPSAQVSGRVHRRGAPVAGAQVHYHARNPLDATAALLDWPSDAYQLAPLPLLPPSFDRTTSDEKGAFVLSDWPRHDSDHWLEVVHPLLKVPHVLALPSNGRYFEFDLAGPPPQAPVGALVLSFPDAPLDARVEVQRDGAPPTTAALEDGQLQLGPIALGKWRLWVVQAGRSLLEDHPVELKGILRLRVAGVVTGADGPPR